MLKEKWKVDLIGSGNKDDLFEAIITAEDGTKLIAQVTLAETANQIVSLHNNERGLTPRAADGAYCSCTEGTPASPVMPQYCRVCEKPRR